MPDGSSPPLRRRIIFQTLIFLFVTGLFYFICALFWEHWRVHILSHISTRYLPSLSHQTIESMIITPSCLLVPLTHVIGQTRYNNQKFFSKVRMVQENQRKRQNERQREPRVAVPLTILLSPPSTSHLSPSQPLKGGLAHIILQAVTWTLFSVAVIILGVAIFWHPTMFGLISSAAMLGIFAQGLMVTSILTFEEDSDPSESSPTSSRSASFDKDEDDSSPDHLIKASQWAKSPVRKRSDSFAHKKKKRRKRDFFLWCMMNYALFQVPFVLKWFYKTVIHTCVDCATGVQNIRDIPAMFTLVATLGIPLFTHGVGGLLFHKDKWSFHHPMSGGKVRE